MYQYSCKVPHIHSFLLPSGRPDPPLSFRRVGFTHDSVTLEWLPGFNGGLQQKFRIRWNVKRGYCLKNNTISQSRKCTQPSGWQIPLGSVGQFPVYGRVSSQSDNLHCPWSAACHHVQLLCQCPQCNGREWLCWQQCSTDSDHQGSVWSNNSLTHRGLSVSCNQCNLGYYRSFCLCASAESPQLEDEVSADDDSVTQRKSVITAA